MKINNYCQFLFFYIMIAGLVGCSSLPAESREATATYQAHRAVDLATKVSSRLRQTQAAENEVALATAQAVETFLLEARAWPVILQDTFDNSQIDWAIGEDEDPKLASIQWSFANNAYRWRADCVDSFVWWVTPTQIDTADFYLAASIRQVEGSEIGEYGLIFRKNENGEYYLFELNNSGSYAIYLHTQDGWEALTTWTPSSLVQPGEFNLIEITARSSSFFIDLNSQHLIQFESDRLPSGQVGLLVGLSEPGSTGVWEFDDFLLRAPEDAMQTPTP